MACDVPRVRVRASTRRWRRCGSRSTSIRCRWSSRAGIGRILHFARRFEEAIAQYEHVLQTNPLFGQAHLDLALTRLATSDLPAARAALDRAERADRGSLDRSCSSEASAPRAKGSRTKVGASSTSSAAGYERGDASVGDLALLAATLGDWDRPFPWLREACAQRAPFLGYVDVEPAMMPLLANPDSRALLQQHGFHGVP